MIGTFSVIIFFSIIIYVRVNSTSMGEAFLPILIWQSMVWLPWLLYGYLNSIIDHRYPIVEQPVHLWILRHSTLCAGIIATHVPWFFIVSSNFSPFIGMEFTGYGAFFFFFIMWAICDFLFYWALLGIYALQQILSIAPSDQVNESLASDYISLKTTGRQSSVLIENLHWIEAEDYCCRVHTNSGNYLVRQSLNSFEKALPQNKFIRIHRSTIINLDFVEIIERQASKRHLVRLKNGIERAVSAAGYQKLQPLLKGTF